MPEKKKAILREEINRLLKLDVTEECESSWASPVVMVSQMVTYHVCVDYRRLNGMIVDRCPTPSLDEVLHSAERTRYMSTIDLKSSTS